MKTPKLAACVAVLRALNDAGPQTAVEIEAITKMSKKMLGDCTKLLVKKADILVKKEQAISLVYEISPNGIKVLEFFRLNSTARANRIVKSKKQSSCPIP